MIGTLDIGIKFLKQLTHAAIIKITNNCHVGCRHCYEPTEEYVADDGCNMDWVRKMLQDPWCESVCLQGGEPMEFPEKCKEVCDIAREAGLNPMLVTSAFWAGDDKMVDYVLNEIKPFFLTISVNKWLAEKVPIVEYVNKLCKLVEHRDDMIIFGSSAFSHPYTYHLQQPPNIDDVQPEFKGLIKYPMFRTPVPLSPSGRGQVLASECEDTRVTSDEPFICSFGGVFLNPDGTLYSNCQNGWQGCRFGHINDYGEHPISEINEKIHRPVFKTNKKILGAHELCRRPPHNVDLFNAEKGKIYEV